MFRLYRKRPIIVQARQLEEPTDIVTPEGTMHADIGDYLIIGAAQEQYLCRKEMFEQTYDLAETREEEEK